MKCLLILGEVAVVVVWLVALCRWAGTPKEEQTEDEGNGLF